MSWRCTTSIVVAVVVSVVPTTYLRCNVCNTRWVTQPVTDPTPRPKRPLIHTARRTSATVRILSWERVSGGANARDMVSTVAVGWLIDEEAMVLTEGGPAEMRTAVKVKDS